MVAIKHRNLKLFTITLVLLVVTIVLLLNYTQNSGLVLWNLGKYFRLPGPFIRFMKSVRRPCSCETCVSETEISSWFDERFNNSISPLLTKENNDVSESTYKWWMKLQNDEKLKEINKAIKELFKVIPGDDSVLNHDPYRCRTCAVVGNSKNIIDSDYGQDIDGHDFVLRINYAPTLKFEKDVGNKITHHFVYPESAKNLRYNASMIFVPFKTLDIQWLVSALTNGTINRTRSKVPSKINVNKNKILVYHPEFMKYIYDKWYSHQGQYPSTGMLGLIFALHICDQVDLYGFGADSKGNWYHYWDNNQPTKELKKVLKKTSNHDKNIEADIIRNLTSINKIKVYRGRGPS